MSWGTVTLSTRLICRLNSVVSRFVKLRFMENFSAKNSESGVSSQIISLPNIEKALLNILDDYSEEKYHSGNSQRALLNILEDYGSEKSNMEATQRAVLNILEDYSSEKSNMEATQRAVLNILEDYSSEKYNMEATQRAVLNILEDYSSEKSNMENTQRAVLNILEDYSVEKDNLENTQRAVLNILEDYGEEKRKVEIINSTLSVANKELEQFAYVASHDLQEPLRTISNFVGFLEEKYADSSDEDTRSYLEFIVSATSKMQNLIKALLDFSRIGRDLTFESINCNDLLTEVIKEMSTSIKESKASIRIAPLPVIKGNEIEIKRLFQNLISNAVKFRRKNVIPEIDITAEEKETEYIFAVKDNSIGIDERHMGKLFIIFQRLHTTDEYPGTGIGLAICKKIVSQHNGNMWVESELGKGSTFYFSISKET